MKATDLDEYISTDFETSVLIMKALNEILWQEKMECLMAEVAHKLMNAGVDFSKADITKL